MLNLHYVMLSFKIEFLKKISNRLSGVLCQNTFHLYFQFIEIQLYLQKKSG